MNTLVPPVQKLMKNAFNLNDIQAFRGNHSFNYLKINKISIIILNFFFVFFLKKKAALYIFYPGEYVLGSALFLLTLFVIKRDLKYVELSATAASESTQSITNPLYGQNIENEFDDETQNENGNIINASDDDNNFKQK